VAELYPSAFYDCIIHISDIRVNVILCAVPFTVFINIAHYWLNEKLCIILDFEPQTANLNNPVLIPVSY